MFAKKRKWFLTEFATLFNEKMQVTIGFLLLHIRQNEKIL